MARRQYKRSPHPGVVLTPRRHANGETTWRARYVLDAAIEANPERFPRGRPIALTKLRERLSQTR